MLREPCILVLQSSPWRFAFCVAYRICLALSGPKHVYACLVNDNVAVCCLKDERRIVMRTMLPP